MKLGDWVHYAGALHLGNTVGMLIGRPCILPEEQARWVRFLSGTETILPTDKLQPIDGTPMLSWDAGGFKVQGTPFWTQHEAKDQWVVTWRYMFASRAFTLPKEYTLEYKLQDLRCRLPGCRKPLDPGAQSCWMCGNPV